VGDELEVFMAVGGDAALAEQCGAAEVVSLEESKAFGASFLELLLGLDFFSEELNGFALKAVEKVSADFGAGQQEINLDVIGELDERHETRLPDKVIQRETEAPGLEAVAGSEKLGGRLNGFEDLEDCEMWRQKLDESAREGFKGAVDEGGKAIGEGFEAEDDGIVEHGPCGEFAVAAEDGVWSATEKQLVGVEPAGRIEDGLAGDVAQGLVCV